MSVDWSPARTTFYASDVADHEKEEKFNRLWRLQHGRGNTYEGWSGQRVRQEDIGTYRRARAILSQVEVPRGQRHRIARDVVDEDLQGFSRYYAGADGATLGFAALEMFDSAEAAADSRLADFASEELNVDGGALMSYVFGKYDQ